MGGGGGGGWERQKEVSRKKRRKGTPSSFSSRQPTFSSHFFSLLPHLPLRITPPPLTRNFAIHWTCEMHGPSLLSRTIGFGIFFCTQLNVFDQNITLAPSCLASAPQLAVFRFYFREMRRIALLPFIFICVISNGV